MIPVNNKGEIDHQLMSLRIINHAIRKQTAIDALARLDNRLASVPPMSFILDDRIVWRIANERAYLESVINKDNNK